MFPYSNSSDLVKKILSFPYFLGEDPAIQSLWIPSSGSPLTLIIGENASGKSFFRRLVQQTCQQNETECISISMEARRKIAYSPHLAMVYGDESRHSTGQNAANTVKTGISTCKSRDTEHVMFWDEPDIGLSDSWSAGVGVAIRDFALDAPKMTKAIFVITHSKSLVRELLPAAPGYLYLGSDSPPSSIQKWLNSRVKPRNVEELSEESMKRYRKISKLIPSPG